MLSPCKQGRGPRITLLTAFAAGDLSPSNKLTAAHKKRAGKGPIPARGLENSEEECARWCHGHCVHRATHRPRRPEFQDCAHRLSLAKCVVLNESTRLIEHVCPNSGKGPRNKMAGNVASCDATHAAIWFSKRCEASPDKMSAMPQPALLKLGLPGQAVQSHMSTAFRHLAGLTGTEVAGSRLATATDSGYGPPKLPVRWGGQQMVFMNGGVAAHAYPLRHPASALPGMDGSPMHVAIWQFLPCGIRGGMRGVCEEQPQATNRKDLRRRSRCLGVVVLTGRGVVVRGGLWRLDTMCMACCGECIGRLWAATDHGKWGNADRGQRQRNPSATHGRNEASRTGPGVAGELAHRARTGGRTRRGRRRGIAEQVRSRRSGCAVHGGWGVHWWRTHWCSRGVLTG
ncbi:unnamed protein product [Symbiodinium microadriaticum]|nr:unnamed protein product [Symbiodinium microadriaticum]